MSYLRGNSVVDGNLYVEGDLLVRDIRPAETGAVVAYKQSGHGTNVGRHLRVEAENTGALIDSSIIENIDSNEVNIYVDQDFNDTAGFDIGNPTDINKFTVNYPIEKLWVIDKDKENNTGYGQLMPITEEISGSTEHYDAAQFPEKITSWGYV